MRNLARATLTAVVVLSLALPPLAIAQPSVKGDEAPPAASTGGQEAVDALGLDLAAVAASHGKSAEVLERALRGDQTLRVDAKGRLFYREAPAPAAADPGLGDSPPAQSASVDSAFTLHSRPGASRTIFLDFDGHTLTGTAWNAAIVPEPLVCPAWDIDGSPSDFNDTERARIVSIWRRVAEDYAPFDVDVTTEDPGEAGIARDSTADSVYGMRILISPISSYVGNYGGIAYVSVFDSLGSYYRTALVFPEKLLNNEKYIGEAAAHECGHTLGLLHDGVAGGTDYYIGTGTGPTGWAPIMGSGYYRELTQWSRGEYPSASNTEDDLAVITSHGLSYRVDDHQGTIAEATLLTPGTTLSAAGTIERTGDVDVVAFAAGTGPAEVSVAPASVGANLDVLLEIQDASGVTLVSANPVDAVSTTVSTVLAEGTYYALVHGAGKGNPAAGGYSDYASLGAWSLSGTVVTPSSPPTTPPPPPEVENSAPVAIATASATRVTAPGSVQFDGSSSFDPDGSIVSWTWDFGDSTTGSGATVSHSYATPGVYPVILTVLDDAGATATANLEITCEAPSNSAPTAAITAAPSTGYAPLDVMFDGSDSFDPDGTIVSWTWDFGDGTYGSGIAPHHRYVDAGTYVATLEVTDDDGAKDRSTATVVVHVVPVKAIHVNSISLAQVFVRKSQSTRAAVSIVDERGAPVAGVTVTGIWSGVVTGTSSAVTGRDGVANLTSRSTRKSGSVAFTVTNAALEGYVYDASANVVTSASFGIGSRAALRRRPL